MAAFTTNYCCCCFSLRTGCLVIMWLYVFMGISWMTLVPQISGNYKTNTTISVIKQNGGAPEIVYKNSGHVKEEITVWSYVASPYTDITQFSIFAGAITVFTGVLGLYSIYKYDLFYIQLYLLWEFINILIITFAFVYHWMTFGVNLGATFYIIFSGYSWIVVFSYYRTWCYPVSHELIEA